MDFHALVRKDLQFLCKKNGIPANLTNVAMANSLQALETVEGIEEIQEAIGLQSPKKAESKSSPDRPRTGRASSRRALHGDESKIKQPSPLPRLRLLTAKALEEEGEKKELTTVFSKTPATRKTGKAAETRSSKIRAKNGEKDEGPSETPKPVESRNGKAIGVITRRSTRLSSRKVLDETDTVQSMSRRSIRAKATVDKMGALCIVDADEIVKEDDKNDPTEKGDSCVDLLDEEDEKKDKEVESHDFSSSLDGEVTKVEDVIGDSSGALVDENDVLFVDVHDIGKGDSCVDLLEEEDEKKDKEVETDDFSSYLDGEVTKVEGVNGDSSGTLVDVNDDLFVDVHDTRKDDLCIELNVENVIESTEDSHQLPAMESVKDFEDNPPEKELMEDSRDELLEHEPVKGSGDFLLSGKKYVEVSNDLSLEETGSCGVEEKENLSLLFQVALESISTEIPKETENSIDLVIDSEIEASSIMALAESSEQIEYQSNAGGIAASKFIDVPLETEKFQNATHDSRTEFLDESFEDDLQNAAEISFVFPLADPAFEKGADADPAEDNLLNACQIATKTSIAASIEFKEAGANLLSEITVVTDKSADQNLIPGTGDLATPESVDVAPQISSFGLQIPASATKDPETLSEIKEDTIIHPAALSSSDEKLPIESAQLSLMQTQLLNNEEAAILVEKVKKKAEKENFIQEDNLKSLSLIKLKAMYKQKLDSKKNELERGGNSMIKREDVELSGSIVLDEQKLENENTEKLERAKNSMIRHQDFEFCSNIKQMLGEKINLEKKTSAIKQSMLDSNWKQKLNEDDKFQSERKRTPLKNLN